jgi:hypothetical protein
MKAGFSNPAKGLRSCKGVARKEVEYTIIQIRSNAPRKA